MYKKLPLWLCACLLLSGFDLFYMIYFETMLSSPLYMQGKNKEEKLIAKRTPAFKNNKS